MNSACLAKLEFDLAYLAMLTDSGLKPLSRWEGPHGPYTEELLGALGFLCRTIIRTARNGKEVRELVFSRTQRLIDQYASWFDGKPLAQPMEGTRFEGLLFGYPECCVNSFVARGYAKNRLPRDCQRILFHWACPDCRVTPALLPKYRRVYAKCRRIFGPCPPDLRVGPYAEAVHQRVTEVGSWVATLLALGTSPVMPSMGQCGDLSHMLATTNDSDGDGLRNAEEWFFRTSPDLADSVGDGSVDGYRVARWIWLQINALSSSNQVNAPYAVWGIAKGNILCDVCGEAINMGYLTVINPVEKTEIRMPILTMHYMEHGGLSSRDSQTNEFYTCRIDPVRADIVVNNHPAPQMNVKQGTVTLHWHGLSNRIYEVNTTVDLASPWIPGPLYAGTEGKLEHSETNTPAVLQKFYKLSIK